MTISEAKEWFLGVCKYIDPDFVIDDDNKFVVNKIFEYCFRLPEFEEEGKYSLNKGIGLVGPYGTGKTNLMKILQAAFRLMESPLKFRITTTWKIGEEFTKNGYEAFTVLTGYHYLLDELGMDGKENVGHFANKINVANDIIMHQYDQFKNRQHITHFTSNKGYKAKRDEEGKIIPGPDNLEEYLDGRAFSRLQEMCNVFPLVGDDRRKKAKPKEVIPAVVKKEPTEEEKRQAETSLINSAREAFIEGKRMELVPIITVYDIMEEQGMISVSDEDFDKILKEEEVRYRKEVEMMDRTSNFSEALKINAIIKAMDAGTVHEVIWRTKRSIIQKYFIENKCTDKE